MIMNLISLVMPADPAMVPAWVSGAIATMESEARRGPTSVVTCTIANGTGVITVGRSELLRLAESLLRTRVPSICILRGQVSGAGLLLAAACDIRLCSSDLELRVRNEAGDDGSCMALLPRLVGYARARSMFVRGGAIDAYRAIDLGLVDEVVPPDEVDEAMDAFRARLCDSVGDGLVDGKTFFGDVDDGPHFARLYAMRHALSAAR